jgi:zinc D-Ala-D-Ala carboxypeptidase
VSKFQYFSDDEVRGLNEDFVTRLDKARGLAGIPFIITSGLRSPETNQSLANAVSDSAHLTGHAVDLAVGESTVRFKVIQSLLAAGFTRIGIYSAHLHVDDDPTKDADVIWYVSGA